MSLSIAMEAMDEGEAYAMKIILTLILAVSVSIIAGCDAGGGSGKKKNKDKYDVGYDPNFPSEGLANVYTGNIRIDRNAFADYHDMLDKTFGFCKITATRGNDNCNRWNAGARIDLTVSSLTSFYGRQTQHAELTFTVFDRDAENYFPAGAVTFDFAGIWRITNTFGAPPIKTSILSRQLENLNQGQSRFTIDRKQRYMDIVMDTPNNQSHINGIIIFDDVRVGTVRLVRKAMAPIYSQWTRYQSNYSYQFSHTSGSRISGPQPFGPSRNGIVGGLPDGTPPWIMTFN